MLNTQIKSFGAYIPAHKVSSAQLGKKHNLPAEWIEKHAGVEERPYFLTENIIQSVRSADQFNAAACRYDKCFK